MSKQSNKQPDSPANAKNSRLKSILGNIAFVLLVVGIIWGTNYYKKHRANPPVPATPSNATIAPAPTSTNTTPVRTNVASIGAAPDISTVEINKAIMVTRELDFGGTVPSIFEALQFIERRSQPDDGVGRTFAVLDAYGEPTPDKKKLHISMHVSTEKPGGASLVFSKTGEVLWQARITAPPSAKIFTGKDLVIYLGTGEKDKAWILAPAGGPPNILDTQVRDLQKPVRDVWRDGEEREVTFVYSSCGCPVKVMAKRTGEKTVRTKELPVIYPDDPAALALINQLMGW